MYDLILELEVDKTERAAQRAGSLKRFKKHRSQKRAVVLFENPVV